MTKGVVTMDPRLFKLMGKGLYRMSAYCIVPRELLQNSWDACKRVGREPQITITFDRKSDQETWITCLDNGCGMDLDVFLNKFMCMGGTSKADDVSSTGKFGIAKAVLMCQAFWSCHTHNLYYDQDMLEQGADIKEDAEWLDGCEIAVKITSNVWTYSIIPNALPYIDYSDVNVHVITKGQNYDDAWHEYNINEQRGLLAKPLEKKLLNNLDEIDCDVYGNLSSKTPVDYYRLNGLVQFFKSGAKGRVTNLFFDFKGTKTLDDKDYPFVMSREGLSDHAFAVTAPIVDAHNAESIESARIVIQPKRAVEIIERVVKGRLLRGSRDKRSYGEDMSDEHAKAFQQAITADAATVKTEVKEASDPGIPSFYLTKYKGSKETKHRHTNLMFAFGELVALVAPTDEQFGVGLTTDPLTAAIRHSNSGYGIFYIVNPNVIDAKKPVNAQVLQLWIEACHEVTHIDHASHNENFQSAMGQLMRDTSDVILENMERIGLMLSK